MTTMHWVAAWTGRGRDSDGTILVFIIGGLVVACIARWAYIGHRARMEDLRKIARRWGGKLLSEGFFSSPRLEIRMDRIEGVVSFRSENTSDKKWTRVHLDWPSAKRLRVTPEGFVRRLRSLFTGGDLKVGDPEFDSNFWIEAADFEWARVVLNPDVRTRLLRLRADSGAWFPNTVTVDLGPTGLKLTVSRTYAGTPGSLEWFLELAALILAAARGAEEVAGVMIATLETHVGSACPVCGHAVEGGRRCGGCATPHHQDCWEYSGGCAIFACAGRARKAA